MRNHDSDHSFDEMTLRRFLLSECGEEEEDRILAAAFDEPELAELIAMLEMQIADQYALRELDAAERRGFERRVEKSPPAREAVALSEALIRRFGKRRQFSWWWLAASAACVAIILIPMRPKVQESPRPPAILKPAIMERIVVWELARGLVRGSEKVANRYAYPGDDAIIDLRVSTRAPRPAESRIETVEGSVVWRGAGAPIGDAQIGLRVPARLLRRDDFILFVEELPALPFSVR